MKKILPLFLTFLFFSCAEDDVDSMKLQSVYTEIEITNCENSSFTGFSSGGTFSFSCSGNNFTYTTNTFQTSAIENNSFFYQLSFSSSGNPSNIEITTRVFHNNSLYETRNYTVPYVGEMYSIIAD